MEPEAIYLIRDNPVVAKLIIAWPRAGITLAPERHGRARRPLRVLPAQVVKWAAIAGVSSNDVATWQRMLFAHEICHYDGTVDPIAMAYCRRLALEGLPTSVRKQVKGEEG
jgi:hypothetical protein